MRRTAMFLAVLGLVALGGARVASQGPSDRAHFDRIVAPNGEVIRLHEPPALVANHTGSLMVGTEVGRVTVILSRPGGGTLRVPGFRFGARFDELRRHLPDLRPTSVAGVPGMVMDLKGSRFFVLSLPDHLSCAYTDTVSQVALVVPGAEPVLEGFVSTGPCEPSTEGLRGLT